MIWLSDTTKPLWTVWPTWSVPNPVVEATAIAEPEITRQGGSILIELPGVKDQDRGLQLVGQTA